MSIVGMGKPIITVVGDSFRMVRMPGAISQGQLVLVNHGSAVAGIRDKRNRVSVRLPGTMVRVHKVDLPTPTTVRPDSVGYLLDFPGVVLGYLVLDDPEGTKMGLPPDSVGAPIRV